VLDADLVTPDGERACLIRLATREPIVRDQPILPPQTRERCNPKAEARDHAARAAV